jgi:sugar phosphate isomerase/epimerase
LIAHRIRACGANVEAIATDRREIAYRRRMRRDQIALQLYTVRDLAREDLGGTLREVAAAGYRFVEVAGIAESAETGLPPLLRDAGLSAIAVHRGLEALRVSVAAAADGLDELGCRRLVVPSLPDDEHTTADGVRRLAHELNEIARRLADRGIRLGYHNHAAEFRPLDGTTMWQVLLAELAPEIELEVDVYWASVGGRDPVEVIREGGARVRLLHMKDRAAGDEPRDAPAGGGTLDMAAIVRNGRETGVEWYIVEQDDPADALVDIATARRNLEALAR